MGGEFLRVHVEIDISKPLCWGRRITLDIEEEIWVSFKYEKLPNFCYWCGMISHDGKDCETWLARKDSTNIEPHEYGPWLRAAPYNLGRTPFIVVAGMGNGLGGSIKHSQPATTEKPSTTTTRTPGENHERSESGEVARVDLERVTIMDIQDSGE